MAATFTAVKSMTDEMKNFVNDNKITMQVIDVDFGKHFFDDKFERYIFKLRIKANGKSYTTKFGQSIAKGLEEPSLCDILCCVQKNDVGTFDDFVNEFGYCYKTADEYNKIKKLYNAVVREYNAMVRLFGDNIGKLAELFF